MRDLVFAVLLLGMVGLALRSATAAVLLWAWAGLMALDNYVYGFLIGFPFGTLFALIALALLLTRRGAAQGQAELPADYRYGRGAVTVLLLLLLLQCWLVGASAFSGLARNAEFVENISKIVLLCLLLPLVMRTVVHVHALLWVVVLSLGVHASLEGLRFLASGGAHIVRGLAKFGDNNHLAVLTALLIPLLLHLRRHLPSRMLRWVVAAFALVLVIAIVATNSRGGLISLTALALGMVAYSKKKLRGLLLLGLAGALLVAFAPKHWEERMQTIGAAQEDSSFMGRVAAWQVSSAIALANPLVGGGFHAVENRGVWTKYQNEPGLLGWTGVEVFDARQFGAKAAHSVYFEVLGDQGFVGFALYFGLIGAGIGFARRLRRLGLLFGPTHWAASLGQALVLALVVFLVGGAGVSIAYSELPFYLVSLAMIAYRIAEGQAPPALLRRLQRGV